MREVRTPGDPKPVDAPEQEAPAAKVKEPKAAKVKFERAPGELPNAVDVDAKSLTAPVMTNQGWVCPDESGRKPKDAHKP
jgi:hypothetical protein